MRITSSVDSVLYLSISIYQGNFTSGEGYSTNLFASRSNPLPFYIPFFTKKLPLRIPSIDKWHLIHIPCLELCISFQCYKCTVFWIGINHTNRTFLDFIKPQNSSVSPFRPFQRPKWQISLPYILQLMKSLPFHMPQVWKRYPFWGEPPCIGHHRESPLPPEKSIYKSVIAGEFIRNKTIGERTLRRRGCGLIVNEEE